MSFKLTVSDTKRERIEKMRRKAKKVCRTREDYNRFIKCLIDDRDFLIIMEDTERNFWEERRHKKPPIQHTVPRDEQQQ